jgi:hypothetical protein
VTPTTTRRVLFALCLVALPFPYAIVEGGRVPVVWLCAVASLALSSAFIDRGEATMFISGILAAEALAAIVGAYLVARIATHLVVRLAPAERRGTITLVLCASTLAIALLVPIFCSTAVKGGAPTGLVGIFGW